MLRVFLTRHIAHHHCSLSLLSLHVGLTIITVGLVSQPASRRLLSRASCQVKYSRRCSVSAVAVCTQRRCTYQHTSSTHHPTCNRTHKTKQKFLQFYSLLKCFPNSLHILSLGQLLNVNYNTFRQGSMV